MYLIVIPMIGIFALFLYLILREVGGLKFISEANSSLEIMKNRYTKGEIKTDEFQVMKEELGK